MSNKLTLEAGKLYSKSTSGLMVEVVRVLEETSESVKFKGRLWSKNRSILYETEVYDLPHVRCMDWEEVNEL